MNSIPNLILIHIGKTLPEYIYDCVYQALLVNREICIYVLLDDTLIESFKHTIEKFNLDLYRSNFQQVIAVPLSIIKSDQLNVFDGLCKKLPAGMIQFRDGFWISTTSRFFYIQHFMELFKIESAFHMENDIMLYEDLKMIKGNIDTSCMYMVQDNPHRVIPSIIYIPNSHVLKDFTGYILEKYAASSQFLNDMELLGAYPNKKHFAFTFDNNDNFLIFDGAAIGQYLGGVDPNNLPIQGSEREERLKRMNNPSRKFVNESCDFKIINDNPRFFRKDIFLEYLKMPVQLIYAESDKQIKQVANLHIHSKQLYQFSSVFNIKYDDIITGDRVLSLCDFIITTPGIINYHRNVSHLHNRMIMVENFQNINTERLNMILRSKGTQIKLFVYTHILDDFIKYLMNKIDSDINLVIYLHNSDHAFGSSDLHRSLIANKQVKHIFAQNPDTKEHSKKVTLLPIGLANSMFNHGDILGLYSVMSKSYNQKKTKNIYVNINPSTFSYRAEVLNYLGSQNITQPKPFDEYLVDLSEHRFCLCVRGNGLDSHRFFESLYLGTIPVIINNKSTKMDSFVSYLRSSELPFFEIREESMESVAEKYFKTDFFNEALYKKMIKTPIQCLDTLKISYYQPT